MYSCSVMSKGGGNSGYDKNCARDDSQMVCVVFEVDHSMFRKYLQTVESV